MCKDCLREQYPQRERTCLDDGSYFMNFDKCKNCNKKGWPPITNIKRFAELFVLHSTHGTTITTWCCLLFSLVMNALKERNESRTQTDEDSKSGDYEETVTYTRKYWQKFNYPCTKDIFLMLCFDCVRFFCCFVFVFRYLCKV